MFSFVLSLAISVLVGNNFYVFIIFLLFYIFYILTYNFILLNISISFVTFIFDEISTIISVILLVVVFLSFLFIPFDSSSHLNSFINFLIIIITVVCFIVFSSDNFIVLYVSYEISLIPIIIAIVVWGSYAERSLSSMMLFVYTSIFTLPFIYVLWYLYLTNITFSITSFFYQRACEDSISTFPIFLAVITFIVFSVNLPLYGLHFWLPMAHVEAPTFGSIILAGVLLNLGGVGLLRSLSFFSLHKFSFLLLSYSFIFLVYSTLICVFQSDFKRIIAYSSVSHMIPLPILLAIPTLLGNNSFILSILFHGLSSPLLFSIVGYLYFLSGTRQLVAIRGFFLISPLISLFIVLAFSFSLCIPPFPSFISEIYFFLSSISLSFFSWFFLCLFSLLSLVYNLNWLSSTMFNSSTLNFSCINSYFSYFFFLSCILFLVLGFIFILFLNLY